MVGCDEFRDATIKEELWCFEFFSMDVAVLPTVQLRS